MNVQLRNLKGTCDFLPQEQRLRQEVIQKLREVFEAFGYQPVETPVICYFDVLASKYAGGAEILKEVYKLKDQGGREIGLRYDLTVPFARLVGMEPEIRLPFKRYEIGRVYRDGPVKTGRSREFTQCDVDVLGIGSVIAEAELMYMAVEIYKKLGLDVFISYNNRKLLSGVIESAGIESMLAPEAILILDKLEKTGFDSVRSELLQLGVGPAKADLLLEYMQMRPDELRAAFTSGQSNKNIYEGIGELGELESYLDAMGIKESLRFAPNLARGLEIYTGTVWEVFMKDGCITSSVGAGGRYDNIIGAFLDNGGNYPAAGMTFGLDVIYEVLKLKGIANYKPPVDLYIIPLGTERFCLKLAMELRKSGLKVDLDMTGRKLGKALEYVNKQKIPYAVVLGENELRTGTAMLKDMLQGDGCVVGLSEMAETLVRMVKSEEA